MNFRTIIGGAFLAVAIAACTTAAAAPVPAVSVDPPARDQWYKGSAPAVSVDPPVRDQWYTDAG